MDKVKRVCTYSRVPKYLAAGKKVRNTTWGCDEYVVMYRWSVSSKKRLYKFTPTGNGNAKFEPYELTEKDKLGSWMVIEKLTGGENDN